MERRKNFDSLKHGRIAEECSHGLPEDGRRPGPLKMIQNHVGVDNEAGSVYDDRLRVFGIRRLPPRYAFPARTPSVSKNVTTCSRDACCTRAIRSSSSAPTSFLLSASAIATSVSRTRTNPPACSRSASLKADGMSMSPSRVIMASNSRIFTCFPPTAINTFQLKNVPPCRGREVPDRVYGKGPPEVQLRNAPFRRTLPFRCTCRPEPGVR